MFFKSDGSERQGARRIVPALPLRDIIVFPHMVSQLFVGRERSIAALDEAMAQNKEIFLAAQRSAKTNDPTPDDIYAVGTLGTIVQLLRLADGTVKVLVEGRQRARVRRYLDSADFFQVELEEIHEAILSDVEVEALIRSVQSTFEVYVKLNKKVQPEVLMSVQSIDDAGKLSDTIAANLPTIKLSDRQALLEMEDAKKRLERLYELMQAEIEILQVEKKIRSRVKKQMEKTQKEYYLNEQMQAIQKELGGGERDEFKNEIAEIEEKLKAKKLSEEALGKVKKELKKLKMMHPTSAEATVVRNYVDWILSLPWQDKTEERFDIKEAEKILDEDHYGLKKPKERIIEYLAVQALTKKLKGPILCFVGPPGVGKTSIARSIARATGRKFTRLSLGGVRDEAEIRGHRRTYIGALPGRIVSGLKKAGSMNPVFVLDEIDKLAADMRGDPAAAMLEVLDPEQNKDFVDHYVEVPVDLSKVMFICTANQLDTISQPLLDRMEMVELSGYTTLEKLAIAKNHLLPKQLGEHGIGKDQLEIDDEALEDIIDSYTREAGVRNLEREIAAVCRGAAVKVAEGATSVHVTKPMLEELLGPPRHVSDTAERQPEVGVITGLAWTPVGGDIMFIEARIYPGKGDIRLTGQMGDVMKESAAAAVSWVRANATRLGIDADKIANSDLHIHLPQGAIKKDGPSAGVALACAVASVFSRRPIRNDVAITGEIDLRGHSLPVGGIKEKVIAAHRAGIKIVFLPERNRKDVLEIPEEVRNDLDIRFATK
ncbi:MAG TPA: endopeptidase La, partial [Polyangiaceae bacterium]|nr:endopeptidase La [Polyangiaceae bacterium]